MIPTVIPGRLYLVRINSVHWSVSLDSSPAGVWLVGEKKWGMASVAPVANALSH